MSLDYRSVVRGVDTSDRTPSWQGSADEASPSSSRVGSASARGTYPAL